MVTTRFHSEIMFSNSNGVVYKGQLQLAANVAYSKKIVFYTMYYKTSVFILLRTYRKCS